MYHRVLCYTLLASWGNTSTTKTTDEYFQRIRSAAPLRHAQDQRLISDPAATVSTRHTHSTRTDTTRGEHIRYQNPTRFSFPQQRDTPKGFLPFCSWFVLTFSPVAHELANSTCNLQLPRVKLSLKAAPPFIWQYRALSLASQLSAILRAHSKFHVPVS